METDEARDATKPPAMVPTLGGWWTDLAEGVLSASEISDEQDALRIAADLLCLLLAKNVGELMTGLPGRPQLRAVLARDTEWQGALAEQIAAGA